MKHLKAFTLIETLVAMILSLLMAGFALMAYELMTKEQDSFRNHNGRALALTNLNSLMSRDFVNAKTISGNTGKINFTYPDPEHGDVTYIFETENIIRKFLTISDSFPFQSKNIRSYFDKTENTGEDEMIEELKFEVIYEDKTIEMDFLKDQDASVFMNMDATHDNGRN